MPKPRPWYESPSGRFFCRGKHRWRLSGKPGENYRYWCELPDGHTGCGATVTYYHETGRWQVTDGHAPHYKDHLVTKEDRAKILSELREWLIDQQGVATPRIPMPEPDDFD